jgi:hypothetical protein
MIFKTNRRISMIPTAASIKIHFANVRFID